MLVISGRVTGQPDKPVSDNAAMSDHYFSEAPSGEARPREVTFMVAGRVYRLTAAAGVFSGDRLDPGTSVLLHGVVPARGAGTLLDLGCGYGVLACVLAVRAPAATVWAVDVNERALALARRNAAATGVADRVVVAQVDAVPDDVTYDEIWSNPPIRIGKPALHDLLLRWLPRLTPHGVGWLVVGRHLGADSLQRWLVDQGWRCDRHASHRGFRVLRVARP